MFSQQGEDVCGPVDVARPSASSSSTSLRRRHLYHADLNSGPETMLSPSPSLGSNLVLHTGPRHLRFASEQTRLLSFTDWPQAMPQKPAELAAAGFFYLGRGDRVQCYYCDGGLKNWDPSDEPWEEHAKWFGDCGFLRIVKGSQFVEEVQRRKQGEDPLEYLEEDLDDKEMQVSEQAKAASAAASSGEMKVPGPKEEDEEGASSQESGYNSYSSLEEDAGSPDEDGGARHLRLLRENRRLLDEKLCKICADREVGVVFVPCGHFACCVVCAPSFAHCPVCRTDIQSAVRTFLS